MTSLSSQLQRLAVPFTSAFVIDADKRKASFLFDPREAATIDRSTFLAIGLNGLEELKQLNPDFAMFEQTLFGEESVSFERLMQTKAVNEELDKQISAFLLRLTPNFQLKAAWKALEWLIYRYHIHQLNVEDLLMCVFPYHETNIFVRAVQMIDVSSPSSPWHWLQPIQKAGVVLDRITVLNHVAADPSFAAFICNAAKLSVKLYEMSDSRNVAMLHPMLPFYASTIAGAISRVKRPSEQLVATIFPYLSRSFRSKVNDYKLSGYMIASQLVLKVKLKDDIIDELIYKIVKGHHSSSDNLQALLCTIAVIFSAQDISCLKAKTWSGLLKIENLPLGLANMQQTGVSCVQLISTIATVVFRRIMAARSLVDDSVEEEDDEDAEYNKWLLALMDNLLVSSDIVIDNALAESLARSLIKQFVASFEVDESCQNALKLYKDVISSIARRHPGALDRVFEAALGEDGEDQSKAVKLFVKFASKIRGKLSVNRHKVIPNIGTSIFVALNSANAEIRRLAVEKLSDEIEEHDSDFIVEALKLRLVDEDVSVSKEAFNALKCKWDELNHAEFLEEFEIVLFKKPHIYSSIIRKIASDILLGSSWKIDGHKDWSRLFWLVAPFLFYGKENKAIDDFAHQNSHLKLQQVCNVESNSERLSKLAHIASSERFSDILIHSMSRRHLAFVALVLSTKIRETETLVEISQLKHMALIAKRIMSSHGMTSLKFPEIRGEIEKLDIFEIVERALVPFHDDVAAKQIDFCDIVMSRIFYTLFDSKAVFEGYFDEGANETGLFGESERVLAFWEICKVLLDACYRNGACQTLYRHSFCNMVKNFVDINLMLILRFSVISDQFYDKSEKINYQACFLQAFEAVLTKKDHIHSTHKKSVSLVPLSDLLSVLDSRNHVLSELAVSCLSRLNKLNFWKSFPMIGKFVEFLVENRSEVISSAKNIQTIFSQYFANVRPNDHPFSPKRSPKRKSPRGASSHSDSLSSKESIELESPSDLLSVIFECLFDADLVVNAPWYLARIMWLFRETDHAVMLPHIVPMLEHLARTRNSAEIDKKLVESLILFVSPVAASRITEKVLNALVSILSHSVNHVIRKMVSEQISAEFFDKLPNIDFQYRLARPIIDIHFVDKNIDVQKKLVELNLSLPLFKTLLSFYFNELSEDLSNDSRRKRRHSRSDGSDSHLTAAKLVILLECLQTATTATEQRQDSADFLVDLLLDIFKSTFDDQLSLKEIYAVRTDPDSVMENEVEVISSPDLVRQLCLNCLGNIFKYFNVDGVKKMAFDYIFRCLQSTNVQTLQTALLCVEAVTKRKPDLIRPHAVECFVSLFSCHILKCDDSYSHQTVTGATSALVSLLNQDEEAVLSDSNSYNKVIQQFAKHWSSVNNDHGRHLCGELFKAALKTDKMHLLATSIALFVCQRIADIKESEKDEEDLINHIDKLSQFLSGVVYYIEDEFEEADIVKLARQLASSVKVQLDGFSSVEIGSKIGMVKDKAAHRIIRLGIISVVNRLLELQSEQSDKSESNEQYQTLFEAVISLATDDVCRILASASASSPTISVHFACTEEVLLAYEQTSALLTNSAFLDAARNILAEDDDRKESDVTSSAKGEAHCRMQLRILQVLAKRLPEIVSNSENLPVSTEKLCKLLLKKIKKSSVRITVRQAICQVLTSLAESLSGLVESGDEQTSLAVDCVLSTLDTSSATLKVVSSLKKSIENVKFTALLIECVSSCCVSLGASAIGHLSGTIDSCLKFLSNDQKEVLVTQASLTSLKQLLSTFSAFTSPYVVKIVEKLCVLKPSILAWETSRTSVDLSNQIDEVILILSNINIRLLVPMFTTIYAHLLKEHGSTDSIILFHKFVAKSLKKWNREELLPHIPRLHAYFVETLDYRFASKSNDLESLADIEDGLFECIITFSLKLTESEMRPLFFKVFDWCSRAIEEDKPLRLVTFYRFAVKLADSLKSLFHLFAAPIFKQAVEVLTKTNATVSEDGRTLLNDSNLDLMLATNILDLFTLIFSHDASGFTNRSRFDLVVSPLTDQLDLAIISFSKDKYMRHIKQHAGPAIVALALAVSEDSAWKTLNQSLLNKTQHSLPEIRLAALHILDLLVTKMSEDYSSALPETVPYLAPLLEDDDETVEAACKDLTTKLDSILGEPISKFM